MKVTVEPDNPVTTFGELYVGDLFVRPNKPKIVLVKTAHDHENKTGNALELLGYRSTRQDVQLNLDVYKVKEFIAKFQE